MLAGVLLHVIEPAGPVNRSADARAGGERSVEYMNDLAIIAIDHIENACLAEIADVIRLSA
jgi:hypothetical protein